jgi:hypothetical protein
MSRMPHRSRERLRRSLPLLLVLAALAWIITVTVLITMHPVPGTGNPVG